MGWGAHGCADRKNQEGGLGCANRVRKGFLGGGRVRKGAHYGFFFFASSSSFLKETLINGC